MAARWAHNPKAVGSNPASATMNIQMIIIFDYRLSMYHLTWPLGQAVKTPPFHGGNRGSIPLGVTTWKFSSAGRASALQAEGHRFDPYNFHHLRFCFAKS